MPLRKVALLITLLLCWPLTKSLAASGVDASKLPELSLQELLDVEITSVLRRPTALTRTASALQVITRDQIRRSGAVNLPEALRLASNLHVARQNSHEWIITVRGFASDVGNKLLVLIDGRSVYTPLFSEVFWDRQDYLLESAPDHCGHRLSLHK